MWQRPFQQQRTLVPATAFFEWRVVEGRKQKQKMRITVKGGEPFCLAGIWDCWRGTEGELWSFAIVTTASNALTSDIHDRQPVILHPDEYDCWMNPETSIPTLRALTTACPSEWMEMEEAA